MDKFNQKWALAFGLWQYPEYAVTIGQTTYYSCPSENVDILWKKHENKHKEQWKRDGCKFPVLYIYYHITKGYENNPYEIEARKAELE